MPPNRLAGPSLIPMLIIRAPDSVPTPAFNVRRLSITPMRPLTSIARDERLVRIPKFPEITAELATFTVPVESIVSRSVDGLLEFRNTGLERFEFGVLGAELCGLFLHLLV